MHRKIHPFSSISYLVFSSYACHKCFNLVLVIFNLLPDHWPQYHMSLNPEISCITVIIHILALISLYSYISVMFFLLNVFLMIPHVIKYLNCIILFWQVSTLVTAANSHDNLCRMDPAWHPWL
jgi:hypothetical protein